MLRFSCEVPVSCCLQHCCHSFLFCFVSNILLQNFYQHKFFCRRLFPIVSMGDYIYIFHEGKFCLQAQKLADCNPLFYLNFLHNDRGRWKIIFIFAFFQFNKTVVSHERSMPQMWMIQSQNLRNGKRSYPLQPCS